MSSGLYVANAEPGKKESTSDNSKTQRKEIRYKTKKGHRDISSKESTDKKLRKEKRLKKIEAINKKLSEIETAINKVSDANTKAALKKIHEYLVQTNKIKKSRKKNPKRMDGPVKKQDVKKVEKKETSPRMERKKSRKDKDKR